MPNLDLFCWIRAGTKLFPKCRVFCLHSVTIVWLKTMLLNYFDDLPKSGPYRGLGWWSCSSCSMLDPLSTISSLQRHLAGMTVKCEWLNYRQGINLKIRSNLVQFCLVKLDKISRYVALFFPPHSLPTWSRNSLRTLRYCSGTRFFRFSQSWSDVITICY